MSGKRISTAKRLTGLLTRIVTIGAAAALLAAAAPQSDYFPLQTGNNWAYKITQARLSRAGAINVGEAVEIEGRQYYRLQFFERELLVRQAEDGSLYARQTKDRPEGLWLPLGADEKQDVQTTFDDCSRIARVESRSAKVKTALGEFDNALEIRYRSTGCADAGTTVQYFIPYVGMVAYETTSIAGPVTHDLTWSRTGATNVEASTNAFTVATDSTVYRSGQETEGVVRLTLRSSQPLSLTFPSSQSTDMRITSDKGETAYFWSADKLFAMVFRESERVGPGEKTWVMSFPAGQLRPGKYLVEGWLTTQPAKQFSATLAIEVK